MGVAGLVVLVASGVAPAAAVGAQEAAATCNGHAVTISFQNLPAGTTTINGTGGHDVIQGGPRSETINAGGGDDDVCGGDGNDHIDGGPGRDELFGQGDSDDFRGTDLAQDLITGGSRDLDVADYSSSPVGVRVDESTGRVQAVGGGVSGGILGIEEVKGTPFADTLVGGPAVDDLYGSGGNDLLDGRGGADFLAGNAGRDRATYANAGSAVQVDLPSGHAVVMEGGRATTDELSPSTEDVTGTRFDDRLVGGGTNDQLTGGGGDDVIKGKGGDDVLEGKGGDDTLFPGPGDDYVDGGANNPVTGTGAPGDLVSYQGDTIDPGLPQLDVSLLGIPYFGDPPYASGVGEDVLAGIESIRGTATDHNLLEGDDGPNVIIGGARTDLLVGAGGNDLLFALAANDSIDAGPGDDYLDGGSPTGPDDADLTDAGDGNDTCTGSQDIYQSSCETVVP